MLSPPSLGGGQLGPLAAGPARRSARQAARLLVCAASLPRRSPCRRSDVGARRAGPPPQRPSGRAERSRLGAPAQLRSPRPAGSRFAAPGLGHQAPAASACRPARLTAAWRSRALAWALLARLRHAGRVSAQRPGPPGGRPGHWAWGVDPGHRLHTRGEHPRAPASLDFCPRPRLVPGTRSRTRGEPPSPSTRASKSKPS